MSTAIESDINTSQLADFPFRRLAVGLLRDPVKAFEMVGEEADGRVARLNLGPFRPYVVSDPQHVRYITRDNAGNYPREGMMWTPFRRVVGEGIGGEGATWQASREILQRAFANRNIRDKTDLMAEVITAAVDELGEKADGGEAVDAAVAMNRIVLRVINLIFFGDRITPQDGERLAAAVGTAMMSFVSRMLIPGMPLWVPMPGDRAFKKAKRTLDEILRPVVQRARRSPSDGTDAVSLLLNGKGANGEPLGDQQIQDDIVALYVASSESSVIALTWLWVVLEQHPLIAERVCAEIDEVVGDETLNRAHVRELEYTARVLDEMMRVHSVSWIVPRTATSADVVGGVRIPAGATILISPYLTHRLPSVWQNPKVFDPDRFAQETPASPAHNAFGYGPHQCLGQQFFLTEATLILAAILLRYRLKADLTAPIKAKASLTIQPRDAVMLTLRRR